MTRPAAIVTVCVLGACGGSDGGGAKDDQAACERDETYQPTIVPTDFVTTVDNPFFPLTPGTTFTFEGGGETDVVEVTAETRLILGVTTLVVHDQVSVDGEVTEDTFDWYAEDAAGNVWYFGEDSRELEGGEVVSHAGSWEAGVDQAEPGIIMKASPEVGEVYRQEYRPCVAEDLAEVVALDESAAVPAGDFTGCVRTRDYTPLERFADEYKTYCPGVGVVREVEPTAPSAWS